MDKQEVGDQVRRQACSSCWRKGWIRAVETAQSKKWGLTTAVGGSGIGCKGKTFKPPQLNSCVRTTSETVKLPIGCWKVPNIGPFVSTHHHRTRPFGSGLADIIIYITCITMTGHLSKGPRYQQRQLQTFSLLVKYVLF